MGKRADPPGRRGSPVEVADKTPTCRASKSSARKPKKFFTIDFLFDLILRPLESIGVNWNPTHWNSSIVLERLKGRTEYTSNSTILLSRFNLSKKVYPPALVHRQNRRPWKPSLNSSKLLAVLRTVRVVLNFLRLLRKRGVCHKRNRLGLLVRTSLGTEALTSERSRGSNSRL